MWCIQVSLMAMTKTTPKSSVNVRCSAAQPCPALRPHGLQPISLLCPWGCPGGNAGPAAICSSRGSSQPRDRTCITCVSCIGRILYPRATRKLQRVHTQYFINYKECQSVISFLSIEQIYEGKKIIIIPNLQWRKLILKEIKILTQCSIQKMTSWFLLRIFISLIWFMYMIKTLLGSFLKPLSIHYLFSSPLFQKIITNKNK